MKQVSERAFAARVGLYQLASAAKVSGTIISRWTTGNYTPSLPTIGKLEKALTQIEKERAL